MLQKNDTFLRISHKYGETQIDYRKNVNFNVNGKSLYYIAIRYEREICTHKEKFPIQFHSEKNCYTTPNA